MTKNCAACRKVLSPAQFMECTKCKDRYHPLCVNVQGKVQDRATSDWICPGCQCKLAKKGNLDSPARSSFLADNASDTNVTLRTQNRKAVLPGPPVTESANNDQLARLIEEIRLLRDDMNEKMNSLTVCVTKCVESLGEFEKRLGKAETNIKLLEDKELENCFLKRRVSQLEDQLNNQEQKTAHNEIEIMGINELPNENPVHLALCVASRIGIQLREEDLDFATRVGPRRPKSVDSHEADSKKPRPLVVRLLRRTKRNEFLHAAKSRRNMSSADMELSGPPQKVFVNERLTKHNRLLFRDARARTSNFGYKYCWTRNGTVFIRKQEGSAAIPIRSAADLDQRFDPTQSAIAEKNHAVARTEPDDPPCQQL